MKDYSDACLSQLTTEVGKLLTSKSLMLVTAESCTGGWVAKCCTDIAGSSVWFERGLVSYSNNAKQDLLGISTETLQQFGAVSKQTVCEMAVGALHQSRAQISVAITGIAGPDGGSREKPVGTVWFAWATTKDDVTALCHQCKGDREMIRRQSVHVALKGIIEKTIQNWN